ncbi:hypothetical protein D5086_013199 [Populus alba]|uniref:Uncharacterized protein n=1 Tax=Populus alba TaxID=43335 RepID=A0ACC4C5K5_POPAL
MSEARNYLKHIAVLAFPMATHGPPLLSLVRRLSASASYAKFSFFSTKESNSKLFSEEDGLENIKPYNVNDGLPENYNFAGNHDEVMDYFFKATPGNFKQAMEVAVEEVGKDFTCIISDAFLWFAADLARELHITWVPLWTSSSRSLLLVLETDLVHQKMRSIINELDPDAVNLFKSRLPKFLHIGPFVLTSPDPFTSDPHGCLEWLDKQKHESVVYISFGSVITLPPQELAELVEALKECKLPFLCLKLQYVVLHGDRLVLKDLRTRLGST